MSQLWQAIRLAWRDWRFETLLTLCAVLALASMLTPLLVLQGLKNGVTQGMRSRLLRDPGTLLITPKSDGGSFSPEFIKALTILPGAAYAIGRTRETATDITLENPAARARATIALEPASSGEPVLDRYGIPVPRDGKIPQLVLSATAFNALKAPLGTLLTAKLARRTPKGQMESLPVELKVAGVLPAEAGDRRLAFAPLALLEDMENYRDFITVPGRGMTGRNPKGTRQYASFRLYASSLEDVAPLAGWLEERNIEVVTKSRDIAAIRSLESAVNQIILIISLAVGIGFAAFTISSSEGAVRRKKRMLGMLRLLGFQRGAMIFYTACQAFFTALCGFVLSLLLYFAVAAAIAHVFARRGGITCSLSGSDALWALLIILFISAFSSVRAAWQASSLEPSLVIRQM